MDAAAAAAAFGRLEYFVLQASNESALTAQAHVLLPAAVHVEDEGTFTNLDGITQRFRRAYPPRARRQGPLGVGGCTWPRSSASPGPSSAPARCSASWGPRVAELASFDWDGAAPPLKVARGLNPLPPARTDGRPGTASSGAPRVRGI